MNHEIDLCLHERLGRNVEGLMRCYDDDGRIASISTSGFFFILDRSEKDKFLGSRLLWTALYIYYSQFLDLNIVSDL